jgi:hypothetical protein
MTTASDICECGHRRDEHDGAGCAADPDERDCTRAPGTFAGEPDQISGAGTQLQQLQRRAAWGVHDYSDAFNADPRPYKHVAHGCQHIAKHNGQLAALLDDLDHGGFAPRGEAAKRLADIVICAMRCANEWNMVDGGGPIDLAAAIEARMDSKGMAPRG